jgi:hypothetical protein
MKRQLLFLGLLLLCLGAMADDGNQTVTIAGTTVNKSVKQITFSGDDVILHFSDNTTQTADMDEDVEIAFELSATYLESINAQLSMLNARRVYNLRGQYMGESLDGVSAGVYIVNGKKVIVK